MHNGALVERGAIITRFPTDSRMLTQCKAVYGYAQPGWTTLDGKLPRMAELYMDAIETLTGAKIEMTSNGAEREQIIIY